MNYIFQLYLPLVFIVYFCVVGSYTDSYCLPICSILVVEHY